VALRAVILAAVDGVGEVDAYLLGGFGLAIGSIQSANGLESGGKWQERRSERRTSIYLGL
jgi:hypothetical protein